MICCLQTGGCCQEDEDSSRQQGEIHRFDAVDLAKRCHSPARFGRCLSLSFGFYGWMGHFRLVLSLSVGRLHKVAVHQYAHPGSSLLSRPRLHRIDSNGRGSQEQRGSQEAKAWHDVCPMLDGSRDKYWRRKWNACSRLLPPWCNYHYWLDAITIIGSMQILWKHRKMGDSWEQGGKPNPNPVVYKLDICPEGTAHFVSVYFAHRAIVFPNNHFRQHGRSYVCLWLVLVLGWNVCYI